MIIFRLKTLTLIIHMVKKSSKFEVKTLIYLPIPQLPLIFTTPNLTQQADHDHITKAQTFCP